jgi:hypothetical protein
MKLLVKARSGRKEEKETNRKIDDKETANAIVQN